MDKSKLGFGHSEVLSEKYKHLISTQIGTFEVFYYQDLTVDREGTVFPTAGLSENALNFVQDGYLEHLEKDLEVLQNEFNKLKNKSNLSIKHFEIIDQIFQVSNIYLKQLYAFKSILGHELLPSDIFKLYQEKELPTKSMFSSLELMINNRLNLASELDHFHKMTYIFSKTITRYLKDNNKLTNADLKSMESINRLLEKKDIDLYVEDEIGARLDIKFGLVLHPETNEEVFAKSVGTASILRLLVYDYYHAFNQSKYVKICQHCNRAFLQIKNYQTVYCDRVYPNSNGKTCRDLGPKEKTKYSPIHIESNKAKDRLRKRRDRGTLSNEDYLVLTAQIDTLKVKALRGKLKTYDFVNTVKEL